MGSHKKISKKLLPLFLLIFFIIVILSSYYKTNFQTSKFQTQQNHIPIAPVSSNEHIRGNKDAAITLVEYSDFECPECQYLQPTIKQILQTYGNRIRWVVRPYPLPQHISAEKEAEAAECAAEIGGNDAYWKFSDLLFSREKVTYNGSGFPLTQLQHLVGEMRLHTTIFQQCLDKGEYYAKINNIISNAANANIQQLPSTVLIDGRGNMQLIVGNQPYGVFKSLIDQALSK